MLIDIEPHRRQLPQSSWALEQSHPLAAGLVGCWIFDGYQFGRWGDRAKYQTLGTLTGNPTPKVGQNGAALNFGTGGNYWTVNRGFGPATCNVPWTIAALVFPTQVTTLAGILCYGEVTDANHTYIIGTNTSGQLAIGDDSFAGGTTIAFSSLALAVNTWSMVAVSQSGTSARTGMLNGVVQSDTTAISTGACAGGLGIGASWHNGGHSASKDWQGSIEYIYSWNYALSNAQLVQLYQEPYAFMRPVMARSWFVPTATAATTKFRKTLSGVGSRVGSRQVQGWN